MRIQPEQKNRVTSKNGKTVLLHTELVVDLETLFPSCSNWGLISLIIVFELLRGECPWTISVIALNPDLIWTVRGEDITMKIVKAVISRENGSSESLRRLMASSSAEIPDDLPHVDRIIWLFWPEMIQYMENITSTNPDELGFLMPV